MRSSAASQHRRGVCFYRPSVGFFLTCFYAAIGCLPAEEMWLPATHLCHGAVVDMLIEGPAMSYVPFHSSQQVSSPG